MTASSDRLTGLGPADCNALTSAELRRRRRRQSSPLDLRMSRSSRSCRVSTERAATRLTTPTSHAPIDMIATPATRPTTLDTSKRGMVESCRLRTRANSGVWSPTFGSRQDDVRVDLDHLAVALDARAGAHSVSLCLRTVVGVPRTDE